MWIAVSGIQKLVLAGRLGEAIELTDQLYPGLLEHNANLLFMLKCRQFIEIVNGTDPGSCSYPTTRSPSVGGSRSRSGSARSSPVASPIHRRNSPAVFRSGVSSPSRRSTVSPGKSGRHSPNISQPPPKRSDEASMNITNGVADVTVAHFVPHSIMECTSEMDTSEPDIHGVDKVATNGFSANGDQDMLDIDEDADMGEYIIEFVIIIDLLGLPARSWINTMHCQFLRTHCVIMIMEFIFIFYIIIIIYIIHIDML